MPRLGDGSKAQVLVTAAWALVLALLVALTTAWNLGHTTSGWGPLALVSDDPVITYRKALSDLRASKGRALPDLLPVVDRTVHFDPLDGRPLFFHALSEILVPHAQPPIAMLEASRRKSPRLAETRLLLLDTYGRHGRAGKAMGEAKSLMLLIPGQRMLIVRLIAGLGGLQGGPEALERALPTSDLKGDVMLRLAQTGADRALLERLAGGMRGIARDPTQREWIGDLVEAVMLRPDPDGARSLWAMLYGVPPAQVGTQVADPEFDHGAGDPPFGWSLNPRAAGIVGIREGALEVYYYGRSKATFASQALMLSPGRYALSSKVTSSDAEAPSGLSWQLTCVNVRQPLVAAQLTLFGGTSGGAVPVSIPADGCPAQTLALIGSSTDIPRNQSARIERVAIVRVAP